MIRRRRCCCRCCCCCRCRRRHRTRLEDPPAFEFGCMYANANADCCIVCCIVCCVVAVGVVDAVDVVVAWERVLVPKRRE